MNSFFLIIFTPVQNKCIYAGYGFGDTKNLCDDTCDLCSDTDIYDLCGDTYDLYGDTYFIHSSLRQVRHWSTTGSAKWSFFRTASIFSRILGAGVTKS